MLKSDRSASASVLWDTGPAPATDRKDAQSPGTAGSAGQPDPDSPDSDVGSPRPIPFRLQAIITINIDAADSYEVAESKRRLTEQLQRLQAEYPAARLDLKARREWRSKRAAPPAKLGEEFELVRARYSR